MLKAGVLSNAQPRPDVAAGTAKITRWKKRGVSILLHFYLLFLEDKEGKVKQDEIGMGIAEA
jgi:hypothetical protein